MVAWVAKKTAIGMLSVDEGFRSKEDAEHFGDYGMSLLNNYGLEAMTGMMLQCPGIIFKKPLPYPVMLHLMDAGAKFTVAA